MNFRKYLCFLFFFFISPFRILAMDSSSKVFEGSKLIGTFEEAVLAGLANQEPEQNIMLANKINREILRFSLRHGIQNRKQRTALFLVVSEIFYRIEVPCCIALKHLDVRAYSDFILLSAFGKAHTTFMILARNYRNWIPAQKELGRYFESNSVDESTRESLSLYFERISPDHYSQAQLTRIRHRVAEWLVLNRIVQRLPDLLETLFNLVLNILPAEDADHGIFVSMGTLKFYSKSVAELIFSQNIFCDWLRILLNDNDEDLRRFFFIREIIPEGFPIELTRLIQRTFFGVAFDFF